MKIIAFLFFYLLTIVIVLLIPYIFFKTLLLVHKDLAYLTTAIWFLLIGASNQWIQKQLESILE
jgi:hypothetical protein